VPAAQFASEVEAVAMRLARKAPLALGLAKLALNRAANMGWGEGREIERLAQSVLLPTQDHLEGVAAFRDKRPPHWQGR
jgi:enoyl-CoA hydratase/carnithine racemase